MDLIDSIGDAVEYERDLYIYADSDSIAASAVEMLKEAGYKNVAQLVGGLEAWYDAGYPIETV